ncbi:Clp protease [Rhodococcoides trifolii]|uniref:Clp protease n=1 Tax=Rhodococcoides trifolii TaxID=908250 RepID=A0A917CR14_9NOCA|nr:Clp protease N-terminal domain-containing protein [Rhodococcus trifolii]GGF96034.1 Clp protease [Rhodococcus trifolii]
MFEKFAKSARVSVTCAQEEALDAGARSITPGYLLLGTVVAADGPLSELLDRTGLTAEAVRAEIGVSPPLGDQDADALKSIGIDLEAVRASVEDRFGVGALDAPEPKPRRHHRGHMSFDRPAKKVLEAGLREAVYRRDPSIELEHIVLGILRSDDPAVVTMIERHVSVAALRLDLEALLDRAA